MEAYYKWEKRTLDKVVLTMIITAILPTVSAGIFWVPQLQQLQQQITGIFKDFYILVWAALMLVSILLALILAMWFCTEIDKKFRMLPGGLILWIYLFLAAILSGLYSIATLLHIGYSPRDAFEMLKAFLQVGLLSTTFWLCVGTLVLRYISYRKPYKNVT